MLAAIRITWSAVAAIILAAADPTASSATSFTMTTEFDGGIGFIDTDSKSLEDGVGKVMTYSVWKADIDVPVPAKMRDAVKGYAVSASETWFECKTKYYLLARLFFYDKNGRLVGYYDKPTLVDQPVPPQTGAEVQFNYVCNGAPLTNHITAFNDYETPLQTLIRAARATLNDPRYVP